MSVSTYYAENKQYGRRPETDAQCIDVTCERQMNGVMNRHARFIEENQLLIREDWELFIAQFTSAADDRDRGWRGEYFGKMMRGSCMTYQYTRNEALYRLLSDVAEQMLAAQDDVGRFSTYSPACAFSGWDLWCRKYVLLGLLHFHEICRDGALREKITAALTRHLDDIVAHIGGDKLDLGRTSDHWRGINSASLLEPVMRMYNLTGKASYLAFARYIIDFLTRDGTHIFSLAAENKLYPYQYPVTKAYEMMSCFEGLAEYYRATGEKKWKTAVINFADSVRRSDITVIGCAGCAEEQFNHAAAAQTDTDYTGVMQETCVTVTWMKLCQQLLLLTGEAKYADDIEQSYYNALCGAVNTEKIQANGGFLFDSYSPLTLGRRGRLVGGYKNISDTKYYGCCVAIGAAGTALPLLTAVTATNSGAAVNFYEGGSVTAGGFTLVTETQYPAEGRVKITVAEAEPGERVLSLRIPAFSGVKTRVSINGKPQAIGPRGEEAFYLPLSRAWASGDVIEIDLDMNPRLIRPCGVEGKEKTKRYFAILYGPLVMARDARLTGVCRPVSPDGSLTVIPRDCGGIDCIIRARVSVGTEELDMIDYGSAGKTWDEASLTEAWIRCE
ncbi:MAG: glycoside hydrolase family 127 protein [Clostridia bacterium]|nr:glycoside hydrolase family 127 protein [Clostridia bacterium]